MYGKSTQNGTPSPGSPVPIVSAGDGGNIEVLVTGKNLLDISKMPQQSTNGITFSLENGGIKISGTATADANSPIFTFRLPAGTYISNMNKASFPWLSSVSYVVERDGSKLWLGATAAFTVLDKDIGKYFYFVVKDGETVNEIIYPQLEVGSTVTPYEPYKSQSLTISTPNGLPGIPVDSGGNYTDAEGQQWVCDEVNDSKRVHRIEQIEFDGSPDESWQIAFNENAQRNFFYIALKKMALRNSTGNNVLICSSYKYYQYGYNDPGANNTACFQSNNLTFVCTTSSFTSIDEWRQFLTENAMTIIYAIANPIETPLSEEEIAAYKALHTYDGTTVISTNEDIAGLKVKYVAKAIDY